MSNLRWSSSDAVLEVRWAFLPVVVFAFLMATGEGTRGGMPTLQVKPTPVSDGRRRLEDCGNRSDRWFAMLSALMYHVEMFDFALRVVDSGIG